MTAAKQYPENENINVSQVWKLNHKLSVIHNM